MPGSNDQLDAKILLVDDQQSNLRLLEMVLHRGGYRAITATSESRKVAALQREHHYDLIVLDLQMPEKNGFEVLEELRELQEEMAPVLVMSADPGQMVPALEAGARSFLSKPFVVAEVLTRVRILLELPFPAALT